MNKQVMFEDGVLKKEFINQNYRGLVGWDCKVYYVTENLKCEKITYGSYSIRKLIAVDNNELKISGYDSSPLFVDVVEFGLKDIPIGELCWFRLDDDEDWWLKPITITDLKSADNYYPAGIVPYLIAETSEKAEELKDWYKSI